MILLLQIFFIFTTTLTVNNIRAYCFFKVHTILGFFNLPHLLKTLQYILTYLDSIEYILISFCHSFYIH